MPCLRLYLFGTFYATLDDVPLIEFRSDKVRALLAYLALEAERPLNRANLVRLLWHGYSPSSARISLRVSLFNLRKTLASTGLLDTTRKTVHLARTDGLFWCDVLEFEQLVDDYHQQPSYEFWRKINNVYKEEFLAGFEHIDSRPFKSWHTRWQDRIQQQMDRLPPLP